MCGLVGVAGELTYTDASLIKRLLLLDFFRGTDSTGLAAIQKSGEALISKVDSNPIILFEMESFKKANVAYGTSAFIGHNRAATRGKVNINNTHPFHYGDIVGAHNGTLDTASVTRLEEALGEKFSVDSQALIAGINALGITETIALCEEGSTGVTGAWALVWHDAKDNTLNFLRNRHRPLWYAWTEDHSKIIWASEYKMIDAAIGLGDPKDYPLHKINYQEKDYEYLVVETDCHYSIKLDELKKGAGPYRPKIKEVKGREPVSNVVHPFQRTQMTTIGSPSNDAKTGERREKGLLSLTGDLFEPFAGVYTEEEFNKYFKSPGCSWCHDTVNWGDTGFLIYERDQTILCPKCSDVNGIANHIRVENPEKTREALEDSLLVIIE